MRLYQSLLCTALAGLLLPNAISLVYGAEPMAPALLLAQVYHSGIDLSAYLVSEKLDGVRALWDGAQLITRQGHVIRAPVWFTQGFPKHKLDGELWIGRGQFDRVSSIVRQQIPNDNAWQAVAYYVFELPHAEGGFAQRAQQIASLVKQANLPQLKAIAQTRVSDATALKHRLDAVVAQRGEGLMLHRADALYVTGRNSALLKYKPLMDAEAKVIAYVPGKGKYLGRMGALWVENAQGQRFKLGTGFKDEDRRHPPAIGAMVTYNYRGETKSGKPRFARFLRVRPPE